VKYLVISVGGILGATVRYWLTNWAAQRIGTSFPYATLIINTSGTFVLSLFVACLQNRAFADSRYQLFFATGFCGAYTTFSTLLRVAWILSGRQRPADIHQSTGESDHWHVRSVSWVRFLEGRFSAEGVIV